jgi:hypothetical protein
MTPAQLRWLEALTTLALDNGYNRAELQLELRKARTKAQAEAPQRRAAKAPPAAPGAPRT